MVVLAVVVIVKLLKDDKKEKNGMSTLRLHFTPVMVSLFWTITMAFVQNIVMYLGTAVDLSKVLVVIVVCQILITLQNQILDLIDLESSGIDLTKISKKLNPQTLNFKIISKYQAQVYFFFRLMRIKSEIKSNCSVPLESRKTNEWMLMIFILLQFFYIYILDQENQEKNQKLIIESCLEAQSYEQIWQKTI